MAAIKRRNIPINIQQQVLHESGYKCSNPVCRTIVTLDIHHCEYVSENGSNEPSNLLVLCPNCHALHHRHIITIESIRTWKMLQISLNEGFDKNSVNILLALDKMKNELKVSGEGVLQCASLFASGLISIEEYNWINIEIFGGEEHGYKIKLTDKGNIFIDAWKRGDQVGAVPLINT